MSGSTLSELPRASLLEGLGALGFDAQRAEVVYKAIREWWYADDRRWCRVSIRALVHAGAFDELADAFSQSLPFGTGGRRGQVGVGPNRINPFTVAQTAQGHAVWLCAQFAEPRAVVLAWDVRSFGDHRGVYAGQLGALSDLCSRDLAMIAAEVYAAHRIAVHALPSGHLGWISTPLLSYAIRVLGAQGGVNISASHNPPDDNGVKVYAHHGGQLVPPHDADLLRAMETGGEVQRRPVSVIPLPQDLQRRWIDQVVGGSRAPGLSVRYSALHGTGVVDLALEAMGCDVERYGPQSHPDPMFSTVPGRVANPERAEVYAHGLQDCSADLFLCTDPDADRLGVAVNTAEGWQILDGHSLAALIVDGALQAPSDDDRTPLVIRTRVTTSLVDRVAEANGATCIGHLLVGFKYIGGVLAELDKGRWRHLQAPDVRFVAGVEESLGALCTDQVRDKDAASAAVAVAMTAGIAKARGHSLVDRLDELWVQHGYIRNQTVRIRLAGVSGQARLTAYLAAVRAEPPSVVAGRVVRSFADLQDPTGEFGPHVSTTDTASRNVLELALDGDGDDGAQVVLRPSGTEPLLKIYIEVRGAVGLDVVGRARVDAGLAELVAWFTRAVG
ncbi:MAG: hypothetical protein GWP91_01280 [Rhodobacterales bacterium]|nr:hypothetical protein [Rhodobacterales bacterium]